MKSVEELREEAGVLRLLGTMVSAGVPIREASEAVAIEFPNYKTALGAIGGERTAEHLGNAGDLFSPFVPLVIVPAIDLAPSLLKASMIVNRMVKMAESNAGVTEINMATFFRVMGLLIE